MINGSLECTEPLAKKKNYRLGFEPASPASLLICLLLFGACVPVLNSELKGGKVESDSGL